MFGKRYDILVRVGDENYQRICGESYRTRWGARKARDYWQSDGFHEDTPATRERTHVIIQDTRDGRYFL